jgi:gliding motility-associated-like protein
VDARFETPLDGCVPHTAFFNNTSLAGEEFTWFFGDGTSSTEDNPTHEYTSVGSYTVKLIAVDPNTCNKIDSIEKIINVHPVPTAEFTSIPVPALENTPTTFHNLSTGGVRYKWVFGDGDSTIKNSMDTVMHQYNATGTYEACLTTYNEFDCPARVCHNVQAIIVPLLDVPTAFTPGRFGRNSIVRVEGFGIGKMTWRIYNRWGQVVFEGRDRKLGWDGYFKGQIQPMDVYAYTLDVEFTDGTKTRKTGDITLIR